MPISEKIHRGPRLSKATVNKIRERNWGIIKVVLVYLGAILLLYYLSHKF